MGIRYIGLICLILMVACSSPTENVSEVLVQTQSVSENLSPSSSPSASPSVTPSARPSALPSPSASPSAIPTESPIVSPTTSVPSTPGRSEILTFTDGYGGDVFTAKDNLLNSAEGAQGLNLGTHGNFELSRTQNAILEFDLSSIPPDVLIYDATLYLYNTYADGGGTITSIIYSISEANEAWQAGTRSLRPALRGESNWNALASDGQGGVEIAWAGSEGCNTAGVDYEVDAIGQWIWNPLDEIGTEYAIALDTRRVAGWFGPDNSNYGILIKSSGGGGHVGKSSHHIPEYRPKLVVHYSLTETGSNSSFISISALP